MWIIGISGKRRSGKTTLAKYLETHHGAHKLSFADPLRRELALLGYPEDVLHSKPTPDAIRALMIAHGQARRFYDPDYWVRKAFNHLDGLTRLGAEIAVIDDVRFWNEAEKLKSHGATLIRLTRFGLENHEPGVDTDSSETELDDWHEWDYEVQAPDGGLADLYSFADALVGGRLK
jgi:hypothetical protein